jgi:hypothetical protein
MQPYETRQASAGPAAAAAQRIGPPAPAGPAPVRQAAAPAAPRQTGFFGSWQQPQQQQAQRRIEPARQPFFFPFFGGR